MKGERCYNISLTEFLANLLDRSIKSIVASIVILFSAN